MLIWLVNLNLWKNPRLYDIIMQRIQKNASQFDSTELSFCVFETTPLKLLR